MADPVGLTKNLDNLKSRIRALSYDMGLDRKNSGLPDSPSSLYKLKNLREQFKSGGGEQRDDSMNNYRNQLNDRMTEEMPRAAEHGEGFRNMQIRMTGNVIPLQRNASGPSEQLTNSVFDANRNDTITKQNLIAKGMRSAIGDAWNDEPATITPLNPLGR